MNKLFIAICSLLFNQALLAKETQMFPLLNGQTRMNNIMINNDKWRITNDGVMGGLSQATVITNAGDVIFSGVLSTENNGGFSSTYMPFKQQPKELSTITIKVTGDGHLYQLRFRRQYQGYIINYKMPFESIRNQTTSHQFNLANAQATFRGRLLSNAPTLTSDSIISIGLLITSEKAIPFNITLHQINIKK